MNIFSILKNEKILDIITKIIGITLQSNQSISYIDQIKNLTDENNKILSSVLKEISNLKNNFDTIKMILYAILILNTVVLFFVIVTLIKIYANN